MTADVELDLFGREMDVSPDDMSSACEEDSLDADLMGLLERHGINVDAKKITREIRKRAAGHKSQGEGAASGGKLLHNTVEAAFVEFGGDLRVISWQRWRETSGDLLHTRSLVREFQMLMGRKNRKIDDAFFGRPSDTPLWIEHKAQEGDGSCDDKLETLLWRYFRCLPPGTEGWITTLGTGFGKGVLDNARHEAKWLSTINKIVRVLDINDVRPNVRRVLGHDIGRKKGRRH
jgi:hypothetical protein